MFNAVSSVNDYTVDIHLQSGSIFQPAMLDYRSVHYPLQTSSSLDASDEKNAMWTDPR